MQLHIFELSSNQRPQLLHQQINHQNVLLTIDFSEEGKVLPMSELSKLQLLHFSDELEQRHSH